ncbi:MAG: hypothetical protein ABI843_04640 [Dokdonella sp.]
MRRLGWVLCLLALAGALHGFVHRPIAHGPGVLVSTAPLQSDPVDPVATRIGAFELEPLADFALDARVLSRQDYRFGTESELSPTDLALGWGRMSDSAVIAQLDISQSTRFYSYRWHDPPPIPPQEIMVSSANMHLIPADAIVADAIGRVRVGEVITLRGQLVEARRADGWHWRSSLRRDDSGAGACELVLVDSIELR